MLYKRERVVVVVVVVVERDDDDDDRSGCRCCSLDVGVLNLVQVMEVMVGLVMEREREQLTRV